MGRERNCFYKKVEEEQNWIERLYVNNGFYNLNGETYSRQWKKKANSINIKIIRILMHIYSQRIYIVGVEYKHGWHSFN